MKRSIFKGCATALCTPFSEDGKVNFSEFERFINFQIDGKVDALVVCGTTGEAATMSEEEKKEVIKFCVDVVGKRVPVIAGTGGNNTESVVNMTKYAEEIGADAALIVTPFYNKTTQKGLVKHYKKIAENTGLPIVLYNVPSRTGVNIEAETCLELSKIDNVVAIKEASGNMSQVVKIASLCRDVLDIYSGNDDLILPILSVGGSGVISVLSNILPEFTHNIAQECMNGNIKKASEMQLKCEELINCLFCEVNPIPVKEALNIMGFKFGIPRLPLVKMTEGNRGNLVKIMKSIDF